MPAENVENEMKEVPVQINSVEKPVVVLETDLNLVTNHEKEVPTVEASSPELD